MKLIWALQEFIFPNVFLRPSLGISCEKANASPSTYTAEAKHAKYACLQRHFFLEIFHNEYTVLSLEGLNR